MLSFIKIKLNWQEQFDEFETIYQKPNLPDRPKSAERTSMCFSGKPTCEVQGDERSAQNKNAHFIKYLGSVKLQNYYCRLIRRQNNVSQSAFKLNFLNWSWNLDNYELFFSLHTEHHVFLLMTSLCIFITKWCQWFPPVI